jgi:Electron transfer DM13
MTTRNSPLTHVAIVLGVVVALLAGLWLASGLIAPTYLTSIIFGVVWFLLASVGLGKAVKNRPGFKWTVRGTFLATAVVVSAAFAWTSLRDKAVNEDVPVGVPASSLPRAAAAEPDASGKPAAKPAPKPQNVAVASGPFEVADEGSAEGKATLVRKASGGRVLTLTDFAVANGPDLRVYLVPGDGTDTGDNIDLGGLKGNKGNQQYDVPSNADTSRYKTVVIWCRAFSVAFARASLSAE